MKENIILETDRVTKIFKGFTAVNKVSIKVKRGDIHALIGPNGAGKTTLFNLLTKFLTPNSGRILFEGNDITDKGSAELAQLGMVRSFQISAVFPNMTLLENIQVALQQKQQLSKQFWRSGKCLKQLDEEAMALLEQVGLDKLSHSYASELSYGRKRALEIATTIAMQPKLMLLDEPTAGMGIEDIDEIQQLIQKVANGRTILMVEHNMNIIANLANKITVLQQGSILAEGNYNEISNNKSVIESYMGGGRSGLAEAS